MLSNWKLGLALAIIFALYSGALIAFGYERAETAHAKQDKLDLEAAIAHRDELQAKIDTMSHENAGLIHQLRNAKLEGQKYATQALRSTTCNPLRGYISLLNTHKGYPLGSPDNPALAAGEDAKPSALTGERINAELEQCEIDYRIAITRLNGLIDSCAVLQ